MSIESLGEVPGSVPDVKPTGKAKKEAKEKEPKKSGLKKLTPETAKLLGSLKDKANKKDLGRKIRDSELIHLGLTKITTDDLETLKESTYTEQDRLKIAHEEYQKEFGKITLDSFIGKLIRGEFQPMKQK